MTSDAKSNRWFHRVLLAFALAAIFLAALAVRLRGADWPPYHPDEATITGWVADVDQNGYVTDRAYPPGFFKLYQPVRAVMG